MADTDEAPSFLQDALAETVYREHTEHIDNRGNRHTHARFHQRRAHVHDAAHVHERQAGAQPSTPPNKPLTAVVQTESVVRQVAVDGAGNTISESVATYTANTGSVDGDARATAAPAVPVPVPSDAASVTSQPAPTEPPSSDLPTDVPTNIPSSTVEPVPPAPPITSFLETTAAPLPTDVPSFSSLTPVNGTVAAGKSAHGVPAFASLHNNTATSHTLSALAATSAQHKNGGGVYTSIYTNAYGDVITTTYLSSAGVTGTGVAYGAPGSGSGSGSGTDSGTGSSSGDKALGASNGDSNNPPPTPVVIGSVVGSLAGVTLIAFLVMLLLRWKRRQQGGVQLSNGRDLTSPDIPSSGAAATGPMSMVRRPSTFTVPAALAALTGQNRKSQATHSSTADSHRSFVRISGRKLPSVLTSGGNGYEDPFSDRQQDPFADPHLSDTSFYRDSRGFYGGTGYPASPTSAGLPSSPLNDRAPPRSPGVGYQAHISADSRTEPLISINASPALPMPDALGRSHPSRDGSRNSRFTEEV
ncbi:hypothetical protein VC83_05301 [Pseudogymnoascus destructans]|uniref:Uncharacterized protein n=2 Tax=Pseudogymnoascus destructans TaxID=655981 RepID=L8G1T7_PSED2|nr:uncharacterized protein VC83_05301 [Pseudogymnoascus destructans]ELR06643.1 hypothetical protein GMDG_00260 [Pseudogymnoascus destructans 20631-21]OAF57999.1 hypothetical protein VC83_05301 [Pseudogymnoascus destructans]